MSRIRLGALVLLACLLCPAGPAPAQAQDAGRPDSIFGVVGHFLHNNVFYREYTGHWVVDRTLPLVQDLGAGWVGEQVYAYTRPGRMLVPVGKTDPRTLAEIRRNRAHVDRWLHRYDEAGIRLCLAILTASPSDPDSALIAEEFSAWIAELVAGHPSIVAVQMHNEPNLRSFWNGTPEQYVDTYRPFAEAIRAVRPDVEIVVGGMSSLSWPPAGDWFGRAVDHGLLTYADAVSVHPYNNTAPPETDPHFTAARKDDPDNLEIAVAAFWQRVTESDPGPANRNGRPLRLYFTEFGYSTSPSGLLAIGSEETQAAWLVRLFLIYQDLRLRGLPLQAALWYDLKDDGTDPSKEQHNFGLASFDLTRRKPAFDSFRALTAAFPDIADLEAIDLEVEAADDTVAIKTKAWRRRSDDAVILAFWRPGRSSSADVVGTDLHVALSAPVASATVQHGDGSAPRSVAFERDEGALILPVTVSGMPSWVVIAR